MLQQQRRGTTKYVLRASPEISNTNTGKPRNQILHRIDQSKNGHFSWWEKECVKEMKTCIKQARETALNVMKVKNGEI